MAFLGWAAEASYGTCTAQEEANAPFADCFALASALDRKAAIVTGDPEFKKVEHLVDIHWV